MPNRFENPPVAEAEITELEHAQEIQRLSLLFAGAVEQGFPRKDAVVGGDSMEPRIYILFGERDADTFTAARIAQPKLSGPGPSHNIELKKIDREGNILEHQAVLLLDGDPAVGLFLDSYHLNRTLPEIDQLTSGFRKMLKRTTKPLTSVELDRKFNEADQVEYDDYVQLNFS
ncbi:hypothetical protein EXS54_00135 [Patescibacteria group bacterium]|nr:hypothetical protein [Patescibacteria group bacterium]